MDHPRLVGYYEDMLHEAVGKFVAEVEEYTGEPLSVDDVVRHDEATVSDWKDAADKIAGVLKGEFEREILSPARSWQGAGWELGTIQHMQHRQKQAEAAAKEHREDNPRHAAIARIRKEVGKRLVKGVTEAYHSQR